MSPDASGVIPERSRSRVSVRSAYASTVTRDELLDELESLDGKFVGVALRPTGGWNGTVLHAQGRIRRGVVDQPQGGIGFGIGTPRLRDRLRNDWAEFEIIWDEVESAAWREDLLASGSPVLAITMRGGGLLTISV